MSRRALGITTRCGALVVLSVAILLLTTRTTLRKQVHATFTTPTQSSSIALTLDNKLVNVNPDVSTVTVFNASVDPPTKLAEIPVGIDPTSVAVNPSAPKAYVANSFSGTVSVVDLNAFNVSNTIAVGAEPMGVAVSPNGTRLYVANSASNSLTVVNTVTETAIGTVDLSSFGTAPRAIAVTNDGDADDTDETIFVALFFSQLRAGKTSIEEGQDDQREGRVVAISAATNTVLGGAVVLGPIANAGFNSNGRLAPAPLQVPAIASTNPQTFTTPTGAFPNQLAAIALHPLSGRGYAVSTAASPNGPLRFNSMAHGLVSVFDVASRTEITAAQTDPNVRRTAPLNLDQGVNLSTTPAPRFFMTNSVAMAWRPNGSDAWVAIQNSDLIVRLTVDPNGIPTIGSPLVAGPSQIIRLDLQNVSVSQIAGKAPRGIVINTAGTRAYVSNFVSRSVTAVDITSPTAPVIVGTTQSSPQPQAGTEEATIQLGQELFYAGRGPNARMSSESWGSCAVCHPQGRSDNVTWMFDAGPRQTPPLDGTFANGVQRILNWSAVRDEVHDFELNTRGVFGGRGLIDDDRLFIAIGGTSGATPTDLAALEQFHQVTGVVGVTNDLAGGAAFPTLLGARRDAGIATLEDGRVFIFGGRSGPVQGSLITGTNTVLEFNPRTNTVTPRNSSGFTARHSLGAAAVRTASGLRIYAIGGYTSTLDTQVPANIVEEYNPAADTWRTVAPLPAAVAQFGVTVAGGVNTAEPLQLVHVVSGNTGTEVSPSVTNANPVQRFQADASGPGTWSAFNPVGLTLRRNHGAATVQRGLSSRVIVVGGQDAAGTVLDSVEEYLAQAVVLGATPHTSLPAPRARFGIAGTLSTNQVYVVGGGDNTGADQTAVFEYSVANNGPVAGPSGTPSGSWVTRGNLSSARRSLALSIPPGVTNLLPFRSAGRDASQDAISLFVSRRIRSSRAPVAASDPTAAAGQTLFGTVGLVIPGFSCATCHAGPRWTMSQVDYAPPPSPEIGLGFGNTRVIGAEIRQTLAQGISVLLNVGTFTLGGGRVNEIRVNSADVGQAVAPLGANGFNIPSVLSVHESAPYFYNGMAQTLAQVLDGSLDANGGTRHHFVSSTTQRAQLVAFLRSIDSAASAPLVTTHPTSQTVCATSTATFTAAATGSPTPSIQWQQSTNGGATFNNIPGSTASSLIFVVNGTENGYQYRAVFTNWMGFETSAAAILTVATAPAITTNPVNKTVSAGASVTFTAAASGNPAPAVRWQSSSDGSTFTNIGGATSTTLTFTATPSDNGRQYRAVFTNVCSSATTIAATLTVVQFTDPTLLSGISLIRAIHIEELRSRVDTQRTRFGLPAFAWTDALSAGVTPIRAVHITELREALRQAYVAALRPAPSYTDSTIVAGATAVKTVHIEELRTNVVALE